MNPSAPQIYGDDFKAHARLEPYSRMLGGTFFFDSGVATDQSVIVLVHGNGDEADTWRHVFGTLATTFRVLALDLPGFGRSQPPENGSIETLTAAVSSFLDGLELSRVHLVGSSMGAVICAMYASQNLHRVSSLTLVGGASFDPSVTQANPGIQSLLAPGIGENYYNGLRTLGEDAAFGSLEPYYANLQAMPKSDLEFLRERVWARVWSDTQRDAFLAALRSLFDPQQQINFALEKLPLSLIWGKDDLIVPIQAAMQMQKTYPQAKLEVIEGAGHLPHQEQPTAFLRIVETFLSNVKAQP